jgi:hypothetical protein
VNAVFRGVTFYEKTTSNDSNMCRTSCVRRCGRMH